MGRAIVRAVCAIGVGLALFWIGNRIGWHVRSGLESGLGAAAIIDGLEGVLTAWPPAISTHRADLLAGLGPVAAAGLAWLYRWSDRTTTRDGEEHGSARWGTPGDIRPFVMPAGRNLLMTASERLGLDGRRTQRNLNVLVVGSSGSGKTRRYVIPNLMEANMSYAVTDPKGEIRASTADRLRERGYEVRCLDLVDPARSDHFNPMAYIPRGEGMEQAVGRLTANILANTKDLDAKTEGFWEDTARNLLNALLTWVMLTEDHPTLNHAADLLARMEASEHDESQRSDVDIMFAEARAMADERRDARDDMDEDARRFLGGLEYAAGLYRAYEQAPGETKRSIIVTLATRLAPMRAPAVRAILGRDDLDLASLARCRGVLYLVLPDTDGTLNFLAAICYQCLFETLIRQADREPGAERVPVHCFLDEFANTGRIPNFQRLVATMRSRGVSASVIVQNFAQGKAMYREEGWETIAGNCDSTLFLGGSEPSTLQWVSKRLGSQTVTVRDSSESRGANGSYSVSAKTIRRELMLPEELALLGTDECVYILRGVPPFRSRKLEAKG